MLGNLNAEADGVFIATDTWQDVCKFQGNKFALRMMSDGFPFILDLNRRSWLLNVTSHISYSIPHPKAKTTTLLQRKK